LYCKECGAEITDGKFCPNCGTPIKPKISNKALKESKIEETRVRNLLYAALLIIVVIGVFGLMFYLATQNYNQGSSTGIQIVVNYTGAWQGTIVTDGTTQSVQGTGSKTFNLNQTSIVSCNFQKMDGSSNSLTTSILQNGQVVKSTVTSASYGVAGTAVRF
jgi:hypothetical protein